MRQRSFPFLHICGCLPVLFAALVSHAQSSLSVPGRSAYKAVKAPKTSEDFRLSADFDLQAINYAEPSLVDNQSQQRVQIGLDAKKGGLFFTETRLLVGTFSEPQSFYYALPEAYVGYGPKDANLTLGRKHENLSFADSFFNFGLVQSHFTNDNVYFIEGGLTGISGHLSDGSMGLIASYNPIFVPNQSPTARVEDGKIVSSNRWIPAPPAKFKFGDQYKDINYAIRDYELTDIVNNAGFMLNAYFGQNAKSPGRPLLNLTYGNQPVNEIALSRDTYSDISTFQGYVYLTPLVLMHQVEAADLNLDYGMFKSTLSYLGDQPVNQKARDQEYIQTLNPLSIYSVYAALDFSSYLEKKLEVYAAAAVISGGGIKDVNSEGTESSFAIADSRTLFRSPVKVGLKGDLFFIYNEPFETDVALTYDRELKGSLFSMQFKLAATKHLKFNVGADLIGVENELPDDAQGNFLDQNKANDRMFAGVNYAF